MTGRREWAEAALLVSATAALAWVDYVTGPYLALALFYVLIVGTAGWRLGIAPALASALAAALASFVAEFAWLRHEQPMTTVWNAATRFVIYLGIAYAMHRLRRGRVELLETNRRLNTALASEARLSRTDSLTGLANSRAFSERLGEEVSRVRRHGGSLCVAYVDLDNFKEVNDQRGHDAGDALLRRIAGELRATTREEDFAARLGGDEFAVLFTQIDAAGAEAVAHRLLERIATLASEHPGERLGASIGIAHFESAPPEAQQVLRLADLAMYDAKGAGKNRVCVRLDPQ